MKLSTLAWGSRSSRWMRLTGIGSGSKSLRIRRSEPSARQRFGLIGQHPAMPRPDLAASIGGFGGVDDQTRPYRHALRGLPPGIDPPIWRRSAR